MLPPQGREQEAAEAIVTVYERDAVTVPFVTDMLNTYVPAVVGVPEIVVAFPVEEAKDNPGGKNVPETTVHVNGPTAVPVALSGWEYGTLTVPSGNDV